MSETPNHNIVFTDLSTTRPSNGRRYWEISGRIFVDGDDLAAVYLTRTTREEWTDVEAVKAEMTKVMLSSIEEPEICTGVMAEWCPIHGACTCTAWDIRDPECPLHSFTSDHADNGS